MTFEVMTDPFPKMYLLLTSEVSMSKLSLCGHMTIFQVFGNYPIFICSVPWSRDHNCLCFCPKLAFISGFQQKMTDSNQWVHLISVVFA